MQYMWIGWRCWRVAAQQRHVPTAGLEAGRAIRPVLAQRGVRREVLEPGEVVVALRVEAGVIHRTVAEVLRGRRSAG